MKSIYLITADGYGIPVEIDEDSLSQLKERLDANDPVNSIEEKE